MAAPALLPDITLSRVEKASSLRPTPASRSEQGGDSFERVQKNLSKTAVPRSEKSARPDVNEADARISAGGDGKSGAPSGTAEPAPGADSSRDNSAAAALAETPELWSPLEPRDPGDDAFALFMPVPEPAAGDNPVPVPVVPALPAMTAGAAAVTGEGPNGLDLRQLIARGATGAKAGEGATEAGTAPMELDLEGFKASLAEAVDGRSGRAPDASALLTGQRALESREGAAPVRQYTTTVETPVQQGDWGDRMAGKISWLANQRISFAEIHLNPADLGPVEVRVSVQNDQASVSLHAQNPSVRDMLELNGNRLRDMLQDNGLNLTKMDVSDQPSRQQQRPGDESGQGRQGAGPGSDEPDLASLGDEGTTTGELSLPWQGRVNTYA